ncbi:Clavaminate synthase-like protein [Aulographum hederae CBS 113979]|uniref:Clavaminate synthase-like protein n=1 Tax=Aulographum hederae CBS 113979 TaxID=1176131 RepID=A0A6G1HDS2_9PEZI|nr:Clavaminate synthase-like protein [Aulographum hederae CBS 113979]
MASTSEEARAATAYMRERLSKQGKPSFLPPYKIPIIDLSPSFSQSLSSRKAVAAQIHSACTTTGFFYITHHSIPQSTLFNTLSLASRFFDILSPAQKDAIHMKNSSLHRGYEPASYTTIAGDAETKEGFNWGYEASLDPSGGDGRYIELDGSTRTDANLWPSEEDLPGFKDGIKEYYGAVLQLARHLFRLFALSLDLDESYFDEVMTHPGGIARLLKYPSAAAKNGVNDAGGEVEEVGLGAHTDYECFTLLLSSSTPGLEILSPSNTWIRAEPVPDSFIVNVADFLMRWTNGVYKSTIHRVVNRSQEERYSVPFFFSINYDAMVETLPTCVSDNNPAKFAPIKAGEYILERLNDATADGENGYGSAPKS